MRMKHVGILIPAYKPDIQIVRLVKALSRYDFLNIIVVDDGSPEEFGELFSQLQNSGKITLLSHAVNLGKGAALKTGFNHFCLHHPNSVGLVTVDADGQHLIPDILKVANALQENPKCLILGSRQFDGAVPLKNRIGNLLTRLVLKCFLNIHLVDTQTGLRGMPTSLLHDLVKLESGRYEFEMDCIILSMRKFYKTIEVPVSTVYIKDNSSPHFRTVRDSLRICFVILRFIGTS